MVELVLDEWSLEGGANFLIIRVGRGSCDAVCTLDWHVSASDVRNVVELVEAAP